MFVADLFETTLPQPPKRAQPDTMYVEDAAPQLVVILPGRFQPWHLGHLDVFRSLQNKFGRDNVYVATSNKTELPKSPFNFTDKTVFMTATGVPIDRIIEVKNPYVLPEQFDAANTVFVVAVGAPDKERLKPDSMKKDGTPAYYKTFESLDKCESADKHGYVIIAHERQKVITIGGQQVDVSHGTQTRAVWNQVRNDAQGRAEFLTQMYGRNDPEVGRVLDKIPLPQSMNEDAERERVAVLKRLYHAFNGADGVRRARLLLNKGMLNATAQEKKLLMSLTDEDGTVLPVMGEDSNMPVAQDSTSPIHGGSLNEFSVVDIADIALPALSSAAASYVGSKLGTWAAKNQDEILQRLHLKKQQDAENTRPPVRRLTKKPSMAKVHEEAAGVGVVSNSKDPRYVTATMGDQNDVRADTLNKEMQAYGLVGRKVPRAKIKEAEQLLQKIRALKEQMAALKRK